MTDVLSSTVLIALAAFLTEVGLRFTLPILQRQRILDFPTARSSHQEPIPRGGGIAILGAVVPSWLLVTALNPDIKPVVIIIGALILAVISFHDDRYGLGIIIRLIGQIVVITSCVILTLTRDQLVFQGLFSFWIDRAATIFLWCWFVNVFNFMDGIDSITAVQSIGLALGISTLAFLLPELRDLLGLAPPLLGAFLVFLMWNRPPARIFLGDVGSIPVGFLFGFLLIQIAGARFWLAALLLPAYYLADSGTTLLKRMIQCKPFWLAHREHAYQRAVDRGQTVAYVISSIAITSAILISCAVLQSLEIITKVIAFTISAGSITAAIGWMRWGSKRIHDSDDKKKFN